MKNISTKTLLLFIISILFSVKSYSQTEIDTTKIQFIAYWAKGDSINFKMKRSIETIKNGETLNNDSIVYNAYFKVIDSTEKSYKISWKYKCDILYSLNLPQEIKKHKSAVKNVEVIYSTDQNGSFLGIENWKTISDMYLKAIKEIKNGLSSEEKVYANLIDPILTALSTKEGIEEYCSKELKLIHYPFGSELDTDEEINYEQVLPTPFLEKGLRANSRVYFQSHNYKDSHCVFNSELEVNAEDSKKLITTVLKNMGIKDKDLAKQLKQSKYEINDFNIFNFIYNPGVPVYIGNKREVVMNIGLNSSTRIDIIEIELID